MRERILNYLWALSVFHWAAAGLIYEYPCISAPRWTIVAIHLLVGTLFLTRSPPRFLGTPVDVLKCLPSFILGGVTIRLAGPMNDWPVPAQSLFVIGGIWTFLSLASLSRSFAIFPAVRTVVRRGPYQVIRHPAYAGELVLVVATAWAANSAIGWAVVAAAIGTFVIRIRVEERLLDQTDDYSQYKEKVRWRILPYVW